MTACLSEMGLARKATSLSSTRAPLTNAKARTMQLERIITAMAAERTVAPTYAGRKPAAATATGHAKVHAAQQAELIATALS